MTASSTAPRLRKSPGERRAEVEQAARVIARESGLEALTLRAVAGRVGVASGLVAHYAGTMDDLVADTFGALVGDELREIVGLMHRHEAPAARIRALLDTLLDGSRNDMTLVWVQAWGLGVRTEPLAARVRVEMDAWQAAVAAEIARGMDAGDFTGDDAAATARHLLAMIDGLNAHSLVRWNDRPDQRELTARAVAGLLGVSAAALGG